MHGMSWVDSSPAVTCVNWILACLQGGACGRGGAAHQGAAGGRGLLSSSYARMRAMIIHLTFESKSNPPHHHTHPLHLRTGAVVKSNLEPAVAEAAEPKTKPGVAGAAGARRVTVRTGKREAEVVMVRAPAGKPCQIWVD